MQYHLPNPINKTDIDNNTEAACGIYWKYDSPIVWDIKTFKESLKKYSYAACKKCLKHLQPALLSSQSDMQSSSAWPGP